MATVTFIKYAKQSAGALGGVAAYDMKSIGLFAEKYWRP